MFVRLAAALGARRGEVCGLRWGDIDDAAGTVTIRRAVIDVAGRLYLKDTKTHAERVVSLDPGTRARLAHHRHAMRERAAECGHTLIDDAYVLSPWPDGSKPLRPDRATTVFRTLREHAGVPGARLLDLRHFVATQLIAAGHDIRTASGRLGHAKTSTTLDIYAAFLRPKTAPLLTPSVPCSKMIRSRFELTDSTPDGSRRPRILCLWTERFRVTRGRARSIWRRGACDPACTSVSRG